MQFNFYSYGFNTQPPEGGWQADAAQFKAMRDVSTHSRPKAAGKSSIANQTA